MALKDLFKRKKKSIPEVTGDLADAEIMTDTLADADSETALLSDTPPDMSEGIAPVDAEGGIDEELDDDTTDRLNQMLAGVDESAIRLAMSKDILEESEANIDAQISALLEQNDNSAEESVPDINAKNFVKNADVFDTVDRSAAPKTAFNVGQKLMTKVDTTPSGMMYIAAGVIVLLIVITGLAGIIVSRTYAPDGSAPADYLRLSAPSAVSNSASYIYVNRAAELNGGMVGLVKLAADRSATVFYFDRQLDRSKYDITLTDDKGTSFGADLAYLEANAPAGPTVARFEPLSDSGNIVLSVRDITDGNAAEFKLSLGTPPSMPQSAYVDRPLELVGIPNGPSLTISNAVFSSTGTQFTYKLTGTERSTLHIGAPGADAAFEVSEGMRTLLPANRPNTAYTYDNGRTVIGRLDYAPVASIASKVRVAIDDLYLSYPLDRRVDTQPLLAYQEENETVIDLGGHSVVLERMGVFGDRAVLVFHAEVNSSDGDSDASAEPERTEAAMDIELTAHTPEGTAVTVKGKCMSGLEGTDVLFDFSEAGGLGAGGFTMNMRSVLIKLEPVAASLDLARERSSMSLDASNSLQTLKNRYLSAKPSTEERTYTVQIESYSMDHEQLLAVIREGWHERVTGKYTFQTRRISAEPATGGWAVTSDEVLR